MLTSPLVLIAGLVLCVLGIAAVLLLMLCVVASWADAERINWNDWAQDENGVFAPTITKINKE